MSKDCPTHKWKYYVAYFCVPINIFLMGFGIVINDMMMFLMGFASFGLVILPIYYEKNAARFEKEKSSEQEDKRPFS
tara:strand:+ start:1645 stop:1875 length:231 start_codon:yes stop_codon:yes gene_type:complete